MMRPARDLRSRVDAYPRVLVAILAKQKEKALPLFLRCIEGLDYPKSSIVLYVRTNNNTDRTEDILREWIARVGPYAGVELDATPVEDPVEAFGQHEWNATRFRVLGNIRNVSLAKTAEHSCEFYFVCDVDNFIHPCTLRELVALKLPIVAPLLRVTDPNGYYSNFFAEIDPNGFYGHCDQYRWILQRRVRGVFEVPVVHCTYLIRGDVIPRLGYLDGSDRYEFVVFSDLARRAGIQQYIDNRQVYGYITFDAESDAAKGIVGERRDDQIAIAGEELSRTMEHEFSLNQAPATQNGAARKAPGSSRCSARTQTFTVLAPDPSIWVHSAAFSELAETLFHGLRHLGHEAFVLSRPSEATGRIIALAAFFLSDTDLTQLPDSAIIYNTEVVQQLERDPQSKYVNLLRTHEVWDYNRENALRISAFLSKPIRYVPFGFVPELVRVAKGEMEDIDVLFYGELNPRREAIIRGLEAAGFTVKHLYSVYGAERDSWIARSKVVLNMHYHQPGVFEIARVGYLLANSKAVVTECDPGEVVDPDLSSGMVVAAYDELVEACRSLVADDGRRHAIEQAGFVAFQARCEADILRDAIATTEGTEQVAVTLAPLSTTPLANNGNDNAQNLRQFSGIWYREFLEILAVGLDCQIYFEIGTHRGDTVEVFRCDTVCVDPHFQIDRDVVSGKRKAFFFQITSDEFFKDYELNTLLPGGPDIAFLDGLHLFENILRDFISTEKSCHEWSVIALHDCLPLNARMAEREFRFGENEDGTGVWWTGDVWRLLLVLKKYRPDLRVQILDCPPTGLTVCTRLDCFSRVLSDNYSQIADEFSKISLVAFGIESLRSLFPLVDTRDLVGRTSHIPVILFE